jgi:hypothetical protein
MSDFHPIPTAGNSTVRRKERRRQKRLFQWMEANRPPFEMAGGLPKAGTSAKEIEAYDRKLAAFFATNAAKKIVGDSPLYRMLRKEALRHLTKQKSVVR